MLKINNAYDSFYNKSIEEQNKDVRGKERYGNQYNQGSQLVSSLKKKLSDEQNWKTILAVLQIKHFPLSNKQYQRRRRTNKYHKYHKYLNIEI